MIRTSRIDKNEKCFTVNDIQSLSFTKCISSLSCIDSPVNKIINLSVLVLKMCPIDWCISFYKYNPQWSHIKWPRIKLMHTGWASRSQCLDTVNWSKLLEIYFEKYMPLKVAFMHYDELFSNYQIRNWYELIILYGPYIMDPTVFPIHQLHYYFFLVIFPEISF